MNGRDVQGLAPTDRPPVALLNAPGDLGKGWVNRLFNPLERMYRCRLCATRL